MARVTIKVQGLAQCQTALQQVLKNVEAGSEQALDTVAEATLADDKANCPVDTGNLRDNQAIFAARLTRQVGSNVEYHKYVEFGTYKMAARPFTTNAFEANKAKLPEECSKIKVL